MSGAVGVGAGTHPASGNLKTYPDTFLNPVQGLKEVHGLLLLMPGAGDVGAKPQPVRNSASANPKKSAGTSINPVSAPQGLEEANSLLPLVPGAGGVDQITS